jgi:hypothetical protein
VVDKVLVAERNAVDALAQQRLQAVLDEGRIARVATA